MNKHTPGPWQKNGMVIASADGTEVCLMGEPAQYAGDIGKMCPNADANARLIAAAPDLLAALKPFAKHGNASCDYVEISSKHLRAAYRAYLDAFEVLWCETCGERPQEVRTEHAGLCHECWISEGRPE